MNITNRVQDIITNTDSPGKVYELFRALGYPKDKTLDPSYKRKIDEFELAKEEREKVKDIYTVFNYDGKLQIFFIETKSLSIPFVRYLAKRFSDKYLRFLLLLTTDYREYAFVFPEFESIGEGRHKLKLTRLHFDRTQPYHTDLSTIVNIALSGDEENWRDIWKKWQDAFSVEKVTKRFFEDYKSAFFELRKTFEEQKIPVKQSHELSQQVLNRLMFLYFISRKRWLNDNQKFIKWYWERYKEELRIKNHELGIKDDTFYGNWLKILFLEAFNNKYSHPRHHPKDIEKILALAPYLNGGLFRENELDALPFHINDGLFEKVFGFFEKYHFTIREELPLDVEVAVDPQMIGYVYESLSNVAEEIYERQDLGIFYTPTVEVDFMCRRSLVEYLANHLAELPREWIYRLLFDEDKKAAAEFIATRKLWHRLEEALDNLAVVDPACGSGAFLVGMLHVLAELYRLIYSHIKREMTEFQLKKKVIGNSLYGVDVMSWAVHSAELRLWLQLIIEEDIPYAERKTSPLLPNLNLRLRIGDSLVQEIGGVSLHVRDGKLSPSIKGRLTSLKREKEKYYNIDPTAKFKKSETIHHEELRIFHEILDDKIITLQKEIKNLEGKKRDVQIEMFDTGANSPPSLFEEQIKYKEQGVEHLKETKRKIQAPDRKPFVWDIDFAEIFGDKGGFDIVIGNPPYVRSGKIAPPNILRSQVTLEDKQEYKKKLLASIQTHYPFIKRLDGNSDLFIYFYFHGLSLLNEKGVFCFITSNSWLDVGYGKDLQEFLLKYCHVKAIYDNEAKRSFEHADVNTIIALLGPPDARKAAVWPALKETARFVMLKKPFEEAINTKNLLAMEKADSIHKVDAYRVYPVKQEALLEEGWKKPEEESEELKVRSQKSEEKTVIARRKATKQSQIHFKEKFEVGKYEGNKWGGKYLRAPDIFFTILEKGKGKLVRLGDVAEVRYGIKTGANEFFFVDNDKMKEWGIEDEFLKPVIKNPRESKNIILKPSELKYKIFMCRKEKKALRGTNTLKYIEWGERQGFHERPSCSGRRRWWDLGIWEYADSFWMESINDINRVYINDSMLLESDKFYGITFRNRENAEYYSLLLNGTLYGLFRELKGFAGMGEGVLKLPVYDVKNIYFMVPSKKKEIKINREAASIFTELGINSARPIREQKPIPLPDRKALDDIVFDILGLTEDERNEVYWAVCELVKNRLDKARSV